MKRVDAQIMSGETRRIVMIFAALVATIVATILLTSWQSVDQAGSAAEARNRVAVAAAIDRELADIIDFVGESDDWDDEFIADSATVPDGTEAIVEGEGKFDEIWLIRPDLRIDESFRSDDAIDEQVHRHNLIAPQVLATLLQTQPSQAAAGLFLNDERPSIYVMENIPQESDFVEAQPSLAGGYILAHKAIDADVFAEIGKTMQLSGMRFSSVAQDETSVPLRDYRGTVIGHVTWQAENPTLAIVASRVPASLLLAGLVAIIGLFLIRQAMTSFHTLSRQARFDPLSRLPNRAALMLRLRMIPKTAPLSALAMLDLDGFKMINDHHGHQVGDAVIRGIAAMLRDLVGESAYIARLGGDEFALLFTDVRQSGLVTADCERVLNALKRPIDVQGHTLKLGVSIGLAFFDATVRATEAMRRADIAMYAAKAQGKMQLVEFHTGLDEQRLFALEIKDQLIAAIANGEITIKYQSIIDARTGRVAALEALVRWQSPTKGNIRADEFIPIAEEFGLIGALGDHIIDLVLADVPRLPAVRIAMNVSAAQIMSFDFASKFAAALERSGLPGNRFEIEVTETSLLRNAEPLHLAMHTLGKLGVRHILDDFGSGYASIGFLRRFPFAAVKVDRSIIADCHRSARSRSILMAIVTLAHTHDMEVIAEGVETVEQAEIARTLGCDYLQGWLYSRAARIEDLDLGDSVVGTAKIRAVRSLSPA
jgi:diguanylate cyclase (GGDEF)-like protein